MIPDFSGQGFDAVDGSGQAFAYGDAPYFGDVTTAVPGYSGHAVGIAVTPADAVDRRRAGGTGAAGRAAEAAGVDAVVGRVEQPEVAAAVAVGPQDRLLARRCRQQALGPEVADQAGVLLGAPAVLALVAAGEQAAAADGQPGGHDAVDAELARRPGSRSTRARRRR